MDFLEELDKIDNLFGEVQKSLRQIQGICRKMYDNLDKLPKTGRADDVREAVKKAIDRVGAETVEDYFTELGVASVSGLNEDQYELVITAMEDL